MLTIGSVRNIGLLLVAFALWPLYAAPLPASPVGFAAQSGGTTGGRGGTTHTVSTGNDLQALLTKGASRKIIYVNGTITQANSPSENKINVKEVSNISIVGSGANGIFNGVGIKIVKSSNIIIQNLVIHHVNVGDKDCISIEGPADHVWIDHCELYNDLDHDKDYYDGLLDVKGEAEYITVSRCYMHHSYKTSLVGSSSGDTYDRKMTYCFNYLLDCHSRTPSYRGGTGHIFNNLFISTAAGISATGINSRLDAKLRIEGNFFQRIGDGNIDKDGDLKLEQGPIGAYYDPPGCWDVKDNIFVDCKGNQPTTSTCSYTPPYSYNLLKASEVKENVLGDVGAQGSRIEVVEVIGSEVHVAGPGGGRGEIFILLDNGNMRIVAERPGVVSLRIFALDGRSVASLSARVDRGVNMFQAAQLQRKGFNYGTYIVGYSLYGKNGSETFVVNRR